MKTKPITDIIKEGVLSDDALLGVSGGSGIQYTIYADALEKLNFGTKAAKPNGVSGVIADRSIACDSQYGFYCTYYIKWEDGTEGWHPEDTVTIY